MRTYDSYKDSGIEWIGEIPRHWEVSKLGRYIQTKQGVQVDYELQSYSKESGLLDF